MFEYLAAEEGFGSDFVSPSNSFFELGVDGERINIFGQDLRNLVPDVIVRNGIFEFTAMSGNPVDDEHGQNLVLLNDCSTNNKFNSVIEVGDCRRQAVGSCELAADPFNDEWNSRIVVRRLIARDNNAANDVVCEFLSFPIGMECERDPNVKSDVHAHFPSAERSVILNPPLKLFLTKENIH